MMKDKTTAVAYPTIPVIFVSSVHPDRVPLHNTMGLAVTDLEGKVRTETSVEVLKGTEEIEFIFDKKKLEPAKVRDVKRVIGEFKKRARTAEKVGFRIESKNYDIYSGSSDSGAAALVFALQDLFGTDFSVDELSRLSMIISESGIRSVYGGLNEINVDGYPDFYGGLVASAEELKGLKIFALAFDYDTRVSAEEVFHATRKNPFYEYRLKTVPLWVAEVKLGLLLNDWHRVFSVAEENCANAHYLIESSGLRCRKKEMMNACIDVEEIREKGLACYWTAGGGRVINVFSWGKDAEKVKAELLRRGHKPREYKVTSGPKIIKS